MLVVLIRTLIIYITIILAFRLMGKRQLGELQPNELVVTIIISNIATLSLQDNDMPLLGTISPIFMLVFCEVLVSYLSLCSRAVRKAVSGNPIVVIRDGKINQQEMRALRFTVDDLMSQLRGNGIFDVSEVNLAIVETSGTLSVFPKFDYRALTAKTMRIQPDPKDDQSPPALIVSDGNVIKKSLGYCGVDENWIHKTVAREGLGINDVFIMTCDRKLSYRVIRREKT